MTVPRPREAHDRGKNLFTDSPACAPSDTQETLTSTRTRERIQSHTNQQKESPTGRNHRQSCQCPWHWTWPTTANLLNCFSANETELEGTDYEENLTELRLGYETTLGKRTYFHIEAGPGYATDPDGENRAATGTKAKLVQYIGKTVDVELKYAGRYGHDSELLNHDWEAEVKYRF
ncbi:MAG: hypothetical protein VKK43_06270 [Synechococcaceae cyanobacterium]|nr:hypothetical protein [Synechococcaceae cyanobacterium]